jgi:putative PIN family toxin of toxin-antitoxin system
MKVVVDTNVLISGAFYAGPSSRILDACVQGTCRLALSRPIVDEYARVGEEFTRKRPTRNFARLLEILASTAVLVEPPDLPEPLCQDRDDDKFIACALAAGAKVITSGDKHLLAVSGYAGITIMRPKIFCDIYL